MKELLGHVIDSERIFSYRALTFARNDQTPLPGYEQNDYVREADFDSRNLADMAEEFATVRRATIQLFRPLNETRRPLPLRVQGSGVQIPTLLPSFQQLSPADLIFRYARLRHLE